MKKKRYFLFLALLYCILFLLPASDVYANTHNVITFLDGTVLNVDDRTIELPDGTPLPLTEGNHRKKGEYSKREDIYKLHGGIVLSAKNRHVMFPNGFKLINKKLIITRNDVLINCETQSDGTVKLLDKGYNGSLLMRDGSIRYPEGLVESRDGSIKYPNGYKLTASKKAVKLPEGSFIYEVKYNSDRTITFPNGFVLMPDGSIQLTDRYLLDKFGILWETGKGARNEFAGVSADLSKKIISKGDSLIFPVCTVSFSDNLIQMKVKVTLNTTSGEMFLEQIGFLAGLSFTEKLLALTVILLVFLLLLLLFIDRLKKGGASIYQQRKDIYAVIEDFEELVEKNSVEIDTIKEKLQMMNIESETQAMEGRDEGIIAENSNLTERRCSKCGRDAEGDHEEFCSSCGERLPTISVTENGGFLKKLVKMFSRGSIE